MSLWLLLIISKWNKFGLRSPSRLFYCCNVNCKWKLIKTFNIVHCAKLLWLMLGIYDVRFISAPLWAHQSRSWRHAAWRTPRLRTRRWQSRRWWRPRSPRPRAPTPCCRPRGPAWCAGAPPPRTESPPARWSRNARRTSLPENVDTVIVTMSKFSSATLLSPSAGVWLANLMVALVREPQQVRMKGAFRSFSFT